MNHRALPAVLMTAVVALATVGCGAVDDHAGSPSTTAPTAAAPTPTVPRFIIDSSYAGDDGPRVAVIGDSLTWAGRTELFAELSAYRVKIASVIGEGIGGGPWSADRGYDVLGRATREYLLADDAPDALVIALGTNNAWDEELTLEMFEAAWPEMVADYHGSCLVVVTATESDAPTDYDPAEAAAINDALAARADVVVDWAEVVRPEHEIEDHIHLRPVGLAHRAELIREAVDSCALAEDPVATVTTGSTQPTGWRAGQSPTAPSTGSMRSAGSKPKTLP